MSSPAINAWYRPTLRWVLNHKLAFLSVPVTMLLVGVMIWFGFERTVWPVQWVANKVGIHPERATVWRNLAHHLPGIGREFMPPLAEDSLLYMPSFLPSASLTEVQKGIAQQDLDIREVPEVESVVGKAGRAETALDPAPIGMIETIILLKPEEQWRKVSDDNGGQRRITKQEILAELPAKTNIPDILPTWLQPIQTRIVMLPTGFRAMMGVKVFGSDPEVIEQIGLQMEQLLRKVPGSTDVVADRIVGKPYVQYDVDREAIARHGVNIRDVQDVIEIAVGGENLTTTATTVIGLIPVFTTHRLHDARQGF